MDAGNWPGSTSSAFPLPSRSSKSIDRASCRDEDAPIPGDGNAHGHARSFQEAAHTLWLAVTVPVFEHAYPIRGRPF